MSNPYQLVAFLKKWHHHTSSGGYHRLANYLDPDLCILSEMRYRKNRFSKKVLHRMFPATKGVNLYNWGYMADELKVMSQVRKFPNGVIHAFYAEDQLYVLLKQRDRLRGKLVGSLHLPGNSPWFARALRYGSLKNLNRLDAAIVVSRSMISDYEPWISKDKLFYIPHGIDTAVFKPGKKMAEEIRNQGLRLLTVGGYGRDWDTVMETVSELRRRGIAYQMTAVVPESVKERLGHIQGITLLSGIDEQELISLYRQAHAVLMPVNYATANNALLEAIACGTAVISTRIGGIPDYLDDHSGWLFPVGDVRNIVTLLEEMSQNPDSLFLKGKNARKKALLYDWTRIAKQVKEVYQKVGV